MYRKLLIPFMLLLIGCDFSLFNPGTDDEGEGKPVVTYEIDTAVVDYKGDNNVVYFDFSTGKKTTIPHDKWHIAFDDQGYIIANSGNYGTGVSVCSTGVSDFSTDFTSWFDDTTKDFTRTDTNANVLGWGYFDMSAMAMTNNVYLLETEAGNFKIQIPGYQLTALDIKIADPDDGEVDSVGYEFSADCEYTYINCSTGKTVTVAPPKDSWDIRFGRTEFAMGTSTGGRSSIAINAAGGVRVASVEDADIDEVESIDGLDFSDDILAIGNSWYDFDHDTKVYSVAPVTYVVETTEGNYAKFQIATFSGPGSESFWSIFEYHYQDDDDGDFDI